MKESKKANVIDIRSLVKTKDGTSYLDMTFFSEGWDSVRATIAAEYDNPLIFLPCHFGETFLMDAAMNQDQLALELLLQKARVTDINLQNDMGNTALHAACLQGFKHCKEYSQTILKLLKAGADPKIRNNQGLTPLMHMEITAGYECFDLMLEKGADVNAEASYGPAECCYNNALMKLIDSLRAKTDLYGRFLSDGSQNVELVRKIYELYKDHGLDSKLGKGRLADIAILKHLLQTDLVEDSKDIPRISDAEIEGKKVDSFQLGLFALGEEFSVCKLKAHIDHPLLYSQSDSGRTLLMTLVWRGDQDELGLLLKNAPEGYINLQNKDGKTALMIAVREAGNYKETINSLLDSGADPKITNNNGETPLMLMRVEAGYENFQKMIRNGADVNAEASPSSYLNPLTPLLKAYKSQFHPSYTGDPEQDISLISKIFQLYQRNGLDPVLGFWKGTTPAIIARIVGDDLAFASYQNKEMLSEMYEDVDYSEQPLIGQDSAEVDSSS